MKQSTKLLSLVLALIMAFSCMTVIGNAILVQDEVVYDSIDDAALRPEQVADMALDLVDNLLVEADLGTIDIVVITLDLTSIDAVLSSLVSVSHNWLYSLVKGMLKNIGALDFTPLEISSETAYQRSDGDIKVIQALLNFIGCDNNSEILSRVVYGMGEGGTINDNGDLTNTAQLNLGLVANFLNLGEIGDMLNDIPGMLTEMVYDMLIYGSYNTAYENSSYPSLEDLEASDSALPTDVDTLDEIVNTALWNLLTVPQDYEWVGEGDAAVKDWDEGSILIPSASEKLSIDKITPLSNSLFAILDNVAQVAIDEIGINALNNNLKKALMEAVEIDLKEIKESDLPSAVATDFETTATDGEESYVTYFAYDRMKKDGSVYYYTTLKTVTATDAEGNPVLDSEGNETTTKTRKYYKANMASGNAFASLINWDWEFVGSDVTTPSAAQTQLLYSNIIKDYDADGTKSIVEGINDLLNLVYDTALKDTVKADFEATVGSDYVGGANSNLMTNVKNIAKYLIANYGELVFGSTSPYAHLDYEKDLKALDTVDLIAMIGPGFFEDVMPQLIMPKNADGTYAFHDGVQIYEFGALVLREFISDITPNVNYDEYIFVNKDVTSEDDRQLVVQEAEQWTNIILNMGMDIAYTYLYNISNFGDIVTFSTDGTTWASDASFRFGAEVDGTRDATYPELPARNTTTGDDGNVYEDTRWKNMLNEVIIWCARYVGGVTGTSVIDGLDVTTLSNEALSNPLDKLSYILNRLLPLGFVNGYSSTTSYNGVTFDFDVNSFFENGLKAFLTDFDLSRVLGLLGRNTKSSYNLLDDNNLINGVLSLVNDILGLIFRDDNTSDAYTGILQCNAKTAGGTQSLDAVVTKANLKITVALLLRRLNASSSAIVINALPVVGKLIKGWGTEQSFDKPDIQIGSTVVVDADGDTRSVSSSGDSCSGYTYTISSSPIEVAVKNGADGVWRHYVDPETGAIGKDQQYKIELVSVGMYEYDGSASKYVETPVIKTASAAYGESAKFTFNVGTETTTDTTESATVNTVGSGLSDVPSSGAIQRLDVTYKVYGEDGNAYLNGATFTDSQYIVLAWPSDDNATAATAESDKHHMYLKSPQYVPYSTATSYVQGISVIEVERSGGTLASKTYTLTPSSTNPLYGFKMASFSYSMRDKDYPETGVQLFNTYDAVFAYTADIASAIFGGDNGSDTVTISGSVPTQETFESTIAYDDVASATTSPVSASWTVNMSANNDATGTFTLKFYDDINRNALVDLAADEATLMRDASVYYTDNRTIYADRLLTSEDSTDETTGDTILRETDSTSTAWVDSYGEVVTATVTPDADNEAIGTYTVDGETYTAKKVTTLNAAEVWAKYTAALKAAVPVAFQTWNAYSVYNFKDYYEDLRIAVNEVEYLKNTSAANAVDTPIDTLKAELAAAEAETTDIKNYTDYKMYRLNRFNDAREDARYYINLKNDASNITVAEIDESFPYTWIEEDDLRTLVAGNTTLSGYKGGTDNQNFILALLEPLSDEEIASKATWLKNKKAEYANVSTLNVEMASVYLELTKARLLDRYDAVEIKYLEDELTSAINMIGDFEESDAAYEEISGKYTARSWAKYEAAYLAAWEILDNPTQKTVFDAKYELMCARNELVLVEEEANYDELETLIEQAKFALANQSLYDNTAEELGQVLAELGIEEEITNADGDVINLFPGSAVYVNTEPYSVDDQDVIDDAATALKEALAKLKFKQTTVSRKDNTAIQDETIVEADTTNNIDAVVVENATKIAQQLDAEAVKALFQATAADSAYDVTVSIVSNDVNYSAMEDMTGFVGTDSTITFYATIDGVNIPVATVKLVVEGDVNGDGVLDVLDAGITQLVSTEHAELEGCYFVAANLDSATKEIVKADYSAVVNKVLA